jgi:hypothetical protein
MRKWLPKRRVVGRALVMASLVACSEESHSTSDGLGGGQAGPGSGSESSYGTGASGGASGSSTGGATASSSGGSSTGVGGGTSTFDPGKLCEVTANDTPLKLAARAMSAGEWKNIPVLYPDGLSREAFYRSSTGANNHLDYAESASWDPDGRCLFYYGGGHNSQPVFIRWCEQDSTWAYLGRPSWINFDSSNIYEWFVHAYDRNAFDDASRTHFFIAGSVWKHDVASGAWTEGPAVRADPGFAGNSAAYFPGLGLIEINDQSGEVSLLSPQASQWEVLRNDLSISYSNFLEYNRTSKRMLLGGGSGGGGSRNVYVLDESRAVHGPFSTPVTLGTINYGAGGFVTEDPHSGGFIFLDTSGDLYGISANANGVTMTPRPASPLGSIGAGVSAAITDYGVILYVLGDRDDSFWLYKPAGAPCP